MRLEIDIIKNMENFRMQIKMQTEKTRIGILGPSGCGKSMTLKMIAGIETPDAGTITYGDQTLFKREARRRLLGRKGEIDVIPQKRGIGYLFQNYALFPGMTVEQNIGCSLEKGVRQMVTERMIRKFHLEELRSKYPGMLSGGQQQRVALARIMAFSPKMILLDEPFSALDVHLKDRMQEELEELLEDYKGIVIMVSHDRDEIYRFSEELFVFSNGRVEAYGNTRELFRKPETVTAARLTGCKNISPVQRIDAHHLEAVGWGILLNFKKEIPEETAYIGLRAHDLIPIWGERQENCLSFHPERKAQLPFETKYYLRPEKESYQAEDLVHWFVQREMLEKIQMDGEPDWIKISEKDVMFLKTKELGLV